MSFMRVEKRYLDELSEDELKKVLEVNNELYDELVDYYIEGEEFWVEEMLDILTMDVVVLGYSISPYGNSYIDFDEEKALTSLGNIHNYVETFSCKETTKEELDKALKYLTLYDGLGNLLPYEKIGKPLDTYISIIQQEIYDIIWDYVKKLSEMIVSDIVNSYEYDDATILEALHRKYIEDNPNKLYVKDDSYIVYETMERKYG